MPRRRLLTKEAAAEAVAFAGQDKIQRSHRKGPWGTRPSLRDIARHLRAHQLVPHVPHAAVVWRALRRARAA